MFSRSDSEIISTGVCMYLFGMLISEIAAPPLESCIAFASVPVEPGQAVIW